MSSTSIRCSQIKATGELTEKGNKIMGFYTRTQPKFESWFHEEFLPNLQIPMNILLRSDHDDTDSNLVNTAWMQFRRTNLYVEMPPGKPKYRMNADGVIVPIKPEEQS